MKQGETRDSFETTPWCAYGTEKEKWKQQGNYYTVEELRAIEASLADLEILPCPDLVLRAD